LIRANNAKMVFQNRLPLPLRDKKPGEPQPEKPKLNKKQQIIYPLPNEFSQQKQIPN
jgi:hypothetical protein